MTGFGRGVAEGESYQLLQLKLNQLIIVLKTYALKCLLFLILLKLMKKLFHSVKRGTFDIYVNYKRQKGASKFDDIDE